MVSIFAQEVLNENITVPHTDNARFGTEINNFSFSAFDISTQLAGFTYVEQIVTNLQFTIDLKNGSSFSGETISTKIQTPSSDFNNIDLLINTTGEKSQTENLGSTTSRTFTFDIELIDVVDTYLDTPISLTPSIRGDSSSSVMKVDGDQNVDMAFTVVIIGRQP